MFKYCLTRHYLKSLLQKGKAGSCSIKFCSNNYTTSTSDEDGSNLENSLTDFKYVTFERFNTITLIGMNRPAKRNAVNYDMAQELVQAIQQFNDDITSEVGVLYGHGGNFCAGYDLEELSKVEGNPLDYLQKDFGPMGPTRMMIYKPLIAAVTGHAVAGGLELALMCDMRICEEDSVFGVFCRRFGVPLIDGGTVRLPAIIGLGRAMDMILTGRPIHANEALQWGLVNRVTKIGTALGTATQLANSLVKYPQICLRSDRRSAYHSMFTGHSMWEKLMYEFRSGKKAIAEESVSGAKHFMDGLGKHGKFFPTQDKVDDEQE